MSDILCFISLLLRVSSFSFICWFHNLILKDRNNLNYIVNICSKIIGVKQRDLTVFCNQQIVRKAASILAAPEHAVAGEFSLLPSGYALPVCKTNRYSKSLLRSNY